MGWAILAEHRSVSPVAKDRSSWWFDPPKSWSIGPNPGSHSAMVLLETPTTSTDDEFVAFLQRFDELMSRDPWAAMDWVEAAPETIRNESEWVISRAEALRGTRRPAAAAEYLAAIVAAEPEFADAHYLLAEIEQELGHEDLAIAHQLETLRLDSAVDLVAEEPPSELVERMSTVAGEALAELPAVFRERLAHVPVLLRARPSADIVSEGFDARALGVFEGPNLSDEVSGGPTSLPATITLFTRCLMDAFGEDETELLDQVRVTVLHEAGHYFCLDEAQLAALGLE